MAMNYMEIVIRLFLAVIIGGAVGFEREFNNMPAGFRTHILVCVGATVISLIQICSINDATALILAHPEVADALKSDIGRMGAQVISGIGFLGAGTIIHEKGSVKGLTTAASIWTVACIGLGIGMGYYFLSILSALFVVIVLLTFKRVESKFATKNNVIKLLVESIDPNLSMKCVLDYFHSNNIKVKNIEFLHEDENDYNHIVENPTSVYTVVVPKFITATEIQKFIGTREGIINVDII